MKRSLSNQLGTDRKRSGATMRPPRGGRATRWLGSALSAGLALAPARLPAATPKPTVEAIRPGTYLSDSIELLLQEDGTFEVLELGGSRRAAGRYRIEPGRLTFVDGSGDVGKTRFPLSCELAGTFIGFAVRAGQSKCKPFSGLSFRSAN